MKLGILNQNFILITNIIFILRSRDVSRDKMAKNENDKILSNELFFASFYIRILY